MAQKVTMKMMHIIVVVLTMPGIVCAAGKNHEEHHGHHHHHAMTLDRDGMTMNSNDSTLPQDCEAITTDIEITVAVGREFARADTSFGFDQHQWKVPPCSRLHVTLHNRDKVRHQWMVHGLPRYLYPQGMFHLEASGGASRSGTFIVPSDDQTYLVHCDLAQHMEKGLKAQLVVGKGRGSLPSIPGITATRMR